jgi:hypothetical protein
MPKIQRKTAKRAENDWMTECHYYGHCHTKYSEQDRRRCLQLTVWDRETPLSKWADVADELLPKFIQEYPCTRPWSWWREASRGTRQRVGGSGRRAKDVRYDFGLPADAWWRDVDENNPPVYESQASYLQRLDLLTPAEQKWLEGHPELLQPEPIEYRLDKGWEVRPMGGGSYYEDDESV